MEKEKAKKYFIEELKISPENADNLINFLIHSKNKYEDKKGINYNTFSLAYEFFTPLQMRNEFKNPDELFSFMLLKGFFEKIFNSAKPIQTVSVILYGQTATKIIYDEDHHLIKENGEVDFNTKGKTLTIQGLFSENIRDIQDFYTKIENGISTWIKAYKYFVLEEMPTEKSQKTPMSSAEKKPKKTEIGINQYQINKNIEKLIDEKGTHPNDYTSEEKNYLRLYSGYGGLDDENITTEQAKASMTEFYTPDEIVRKMWAIAYDHGFKAGNSVLEPSVGTGQFLKYVPSTSMAWGYEISKYSYAICKILFPQYHFFNAAFETIFIKDRDSVKSKINDIQKYDLVIGNPPYGDVGGTYMGMGEKQYTGAKNWIEYFILRGIDLLKPDGLLIYIIGTEVANGGTPFLQQGTSKIKTMIAERANLVNAYRLPNGVFERTDVLSDIIVFQKR